MPRYWTINKQPLYCGSWVASGVYIENLYMPKNPLSIILNLAIGITGVTPVAGSPDQNTIFPNQFEIDYIRVYQRIPQDGFYDLCNGREIVGPNIICSGEQTYIYKGSSSNLKWFASSNLIIDHSTGNSISIHPVDTTFGNAGWIKVWDDIPCSQDTLTKNIWIGKPSMPKIEPSGYPTVQMNYGALLTVRIDSSLGADSQDANWWSTGSISIFGNNIRRNCVFQTVNYGFGNFYVKTQNTCGFSPTVGGTVDVVQSAGGGGIPVPMTATPNPTDKSLDIAPAESLLTDTLNNKIERLSIQTVSFIRLLTGKVTTLPKKRFNTSKIKVNTSQLKNGIYNLSIKLSNGKVINKKVVIKHEH